MAIKSYIYQSDGNVTSDTLTPLLASGAAPVISNVSGSSLVVITLDDTHKEDLDDAMRQLGFFFVGEQTGAVATGRRDFGVLASDPADPAPSLGDHYFNSVLELDKWFDGTSWVTMPIVTDPLLDYVFSDASPAVIVPLAAGAVVEWLKLVVSTTFDDASATLEVGTPASPGAVLSAVQNNPEDAAVYITDCPLRVSVATSLILTISPAASTQGAGYVLARIRQ